MSEKTMRGRVVKELKGLDAMPVENPVRPGTPDVNFTTGWMELKWMRRWPRNCDTSPVLLPHFTPQQRIWLRRRWEACLGAWLLLQVGQEWLLFTGGEAAAIVGKATRTELREAAVKRWERGMKGGELVKCLS